ncbi:unnamed protein product [Gordionus sp. m RMFG-2023]|uniref:uncharacterized protein LOC135924274 n=1 Tax=Gordionus sp. m RMFG-2023 TaxID=3053472 RepID=UPI0030E59513
MFNIGKKRPGINVCTSTSDTNDLTDNDDYGSAHTQHDPINVVKDSGSTNNMMAKFVAKSKQFNLVQSEHSRLKTSIEGITRELYQAQAQIISCIRQKNEMQKTVTDKEKLLIKCKTILSEIKTEQESLKMANRKWWADRFSALDSLRYFQDRIRVREAIINRNEKEYRDIEEHLENYCKYEKILIQEIDQLGKLRLKELREKEEKEKLQEEMRRRGQKSDSRIGLKNFRHNKQQDRNHSPFKMKKAYSDKNDKSTVAGLFTLGRHQPNIVLEALTIQGDNKGIAEGGYESNSEDEFLDIRNKNKEKGSKIHKAKKAHKMPSFKFSKLNRLSMFGHKKTITKDDDHN